MSQHYKTLIDGEWIDTGHSLEVINKWYDEGHVITFFTSRTEEHREYTERC